MAHFKKNIVHGHTDFWFEVYSTKLAEANHFSCISVKSQTFARPDVNCGSTLVGAEISPGFRVWVGEIYNFVKAFRESGLFMTLPLPWHYNYHDFTTTVTKPLPWQNHYRDKTITMTLPLPWHYHYHDITTTMTLQITLHYIYITVVSLVYQGRHQLFKRGIMGP